MRLVFCRKADPESWAIRTFTWSQWSHVALVTDEGTAIEAVMPRVREVPLQTVLEKYPVTSIVDVPCRDEATAICWARAQVGCRYDWTALLGFLAHRDWTEADRWFCSELAAAALARGGSPVVRADCVDRVTPGLLWMVCP